MREIEADRVKRWIFSVGGDLKAQIAGYCQHAPVGRQHIPMQDAQTFRIPFRSRILDADPGLRNSICGGSSREDQKGMWQSPPLCGLEAAAAPATVGGEPKTTKSLGRPGKTVLSNDPRARRPAATGALIGVASSGWLDGAKSGNAVSTRSIHRGLRHFLAPPIVWSSGMAQSIAASYLALLLIPTTHHVSEESADAPFQGPSVPRASLDEPRDNLYGLLDQLLFLLPTQDGGDPSIFTRGGSGRSGQASD